MVDKICIKLTIPHSKPLKLHIHPQSHDGNVLYLELMRLQFALSRFGSKSRHIGADGNQSFGVGIKNYGCDQTTGCAHCYTHVHHMVPGKIKTYQYG